MAMRKIVLNGFGIILAVLCFLPLFASATEQESVQLFTNGSIYIDAEKKADNLLVIDGVVKELNISSYRYKNATVIDLKGAAVYPGFIDSHVHLMETGYFFYVGANLIGCNDSASIARVLADKVKSIPEG
jgi:predicted amidohydrolase YtcJ